MVDTWIERARHTQHGFTDLKRMAGEIVTEHDTAGRDTIAHQLYAAEVLVMETMVAIMGAPVLKLSPFQPTTDECRRMPGSKKNIIRVIRVIRQR